jgi:hypothetical protein
MQREPCGDVADISGADDADGLAVDVEALAERKCRGWLMMRTGKDQQTNQDRLVGANMVVLLLECSHSHSNTVCNTCSGLIMIVIINIMIVVINIIIK